MNAQATDPIRILPAQVAARIAAGEVITRPLAVVRELLDNAIDAGASDIEVHIEHGGYRLIAVHDDGHGISRTDAALVGERHATSKLTGDEPAGVTTLGFRGEALASIIAVADFDIRTRHAGEPVGTLISARAGCKDVLRPISRNVGTSVEVRDLFAAYPVRRAAADPARELGAIQRWVARAAVVHTQVAFRLRVDRGVTLQTSGTDEQAALAEVFGAEVAQRFLRIGPREHSGTAFVGWVGGPSLHRSRRDSIVVAVNGRLCDIPEISRAIDSAAAENFPRRRYPYVILHIDAPAAWVDVNVHPAKAEVALLDSATLAQHIRQELRRELGRGLHEPTPAVRLALADQDLPRYRLSEVPTEYQSTPDWGALIVLRGNLPELRILGQLDETLIVCASELGTLLIDQHRAHERVIYEALLARSTVAVQPAVHVTLTQRQDVLLQTRFDDLTESGWSLRDTGPGVWQVEAVPAGFDPEDLSAVLDRAIIDGSESILAAAACHAAIRKRRPLSPGVAHALLGALTNTAQPATCPHGQPIVLRLDRQFLERQFEWR